ncbi:hypothetical protein [Saccharothrix coeruleofusca]|uniref:Uncharacterized protein n=1 Tax=Saccharothrix coeruleofusca TaxID=33919 RepID=A0A918EFX1_9PSEU|nr:hypothetical protein [Saccharothrix coeruleofusca]MBP2337659.1 hypothetical protein [Saccharothrix coeruleofusca]GGP64346.1 hypothetical protein GCM10010185_41030 [Saccharothrix coeruleofusca]
MSIPAADGRRPEGVDDTTVEAVGRLTEALETTERARGHLFSFHQLTGGADGQVADAARLLREAGHTELAERLEAELVGHNVVPGRWTFQLVEEYDEGYYQLFRDWERKVRDELLGGVRHVFESEMKQRNTTDGRSGHEMNP